MLPSVPPAKQFCSAASIVTAATPTSNTNEHKSSPELRLYNYEKKKKMGQVWKTSWPRVMEDGLWIRRSGFKALHPNVSMHILHTVL